MFTAQLTQLLLGALSARVSMLKIASERGDVAEKIVIVGVFVALAIAVGLIITKAVTRDANQIANTISNANN